MINRDLKYISGLGNHLSSEALPGALPKQQNSPQHVPFGLYAEQLSGTAFTARRHENQATWLYRILPSVKHSPLIPDPHLTSQLFYKPNLWSPNQTRWNPRSFPTSKIDFLTSMKTLCGSGSAEAEQGCHIHLYSFNESMKTTAFMNADGDFLFLPQQGSIEIKTEMGILHVEPEELAVIPRGLKFQVNPLEPQCRGYVGEIFGLSLRLPELGVIGANGLAHPRHFLIPQAWYEENTGPFSIIVKFNHELWRTEQNHSPFDVVAWHGSFYPYKYDLRLFNTLNTVSFDHPDPSIFTVLTSPSTVPGVANVDFVIFPPRWMVAENTFRPPYFHRNCMSEYMGLIKGRYDAKSGEGFVPGGGSLHNQFSAHGPDYETFESSLNNSAPYKIENTLAFMFESRRPYRLTEYAQDPNLLQPHYFQCWQGIRKHFTGSN